jgi:hypothetical protein
MHSIFATVALVLMTSVQDAQGIKLQNVAKAVDDTNASMTMTVVAEGICCSSIYYDPDLFYGSPE